MPIICLWCANTHTLGMPEEFGRRAHRKFDAANKHCCMDQFLHLPTAADIKSIVKLHKLQHNCDEMFPLLDYTHTEKNIQRLGMEHLKEKNNPLIVLEAIYNYHTFFGMLPLGMQEHQTTTIY